MVSRGFIFRVLYAGFKWSDALRANAIRQRWMSLPGVTLAADAEIDPSVSFESPRGGIWQGGTIAIDSAAHLAVGVVLAPWMKGSIRIGKGTFIGPYVVIYGEGGVTIGPDCMIAGHTFIAASNHQFGRTDIRVADLPSMAKGIVIGRNVWLGAGVIVLDGVRIGDDSVVGAGSVVTRDVPDGSLVVGNPARVVRELRSKTAGVS